MNTIETAIAAHRVAYAAQLTAQAAYDAKMNEGDEVCVATLQACDAAYAVYFAALAAIPANAAGAFFVAQAAAGF